MNEILLFLHCVGFAITIGAALYDRCYIVRNIRHARGSALELALIRIYLSTSPLYGIGSALVLASGVGLSVIHGSGFFTLSAIGLKQYLFLGIGLMFLVYIIPLMLKINQLLDAVPNSSTEMSGSDTSRFGASDACRSRLERLYLLLDAVTIMTALTLAVAIWKPDLPGLL